MRAKRKGHPDEGWPLVPNRGLANAYNFPAALGRDPGLFLDSDTGVHLGLYRIAGSWNELSVVAFNGLDGISEHLGDREDVNASCQHIASERIPASSWLRSLGRKGCGPRRTSFNPTLTRHRAENECPRDWTVCEKQQRKGGKNGSQLCFTM
jgi:hypothetical protein